MKKDKIVKYIVSVIALILLAIASSKGLIKIDEDDSANNALANNVIVESTDIGESTVSYSEEESKAEAPLRFRNKELLNSHYEKHGIDMGFASAKEYEIAASAVVFNPEALHKQEKEDGDDVYYIEKTNEFVIVSKDGFIRTFFYPESGIKYYNKQ